MLIKNLEIVYKQKSDVPICSCEKYLQIVSSKDMQMISEDALKNLAFHCFLQNISNQCAMLQSNSS